MKNTQAKQSIESRLVDLDNLVSPGNPFASSTDASTASGSLSGGKIRTLSGSSPQTALNQMPSFQQKQQQAMGGAYPNYSMGKNRQQANNNVFF